MKFRFIWIGKTKDQNWKTLQDEYLRRLSHFVKCEIVEIKDSSPPWKARILRANEFSSALNPKTFAVLLDVKGEAISSPGSGGKGRELAESRPKGSQLPHRRS